MWLLVGCVPVQLELMDLAGGLYRERTGRFGGKSCGEMGIILGYIIYTQNTVIKQKR